MPDLDWIIEYETLPPDEPYSPEPPAPDDRPRRVPRWLWLLVGLVVIATGILIYLWSLGGKTEPLPNPDPPQTRLEAVVQMEINALGAGDQEIFNQVQDNPSRRANKQPPPEQWFAADSDLAGEVELVDIQLIDENSAQAKVKLTWDGTPYRLVWYYRQEDERWLHTDWQQPELGPSAWLTSTHLRIIYYQTELDQATALMSRLETYIAELCGVVPCPAEPFSATLKFDRYSPYYHAGRDYALQYRLPSPWRIRWPYDNQPEPLVLGSLGRHLAYDLLLARPAWPSLNPENKAALILSTYWLAHHLLELETLPTTHWLEEAVERDGLPAAAAFIVALKEGFEPHEALAVFEPETAAAVTALPDYFGWLTLIMDPENTILPQYYSSDHLPPWRRPLQVRFDWEADPWAPAGQVYRRAAPEVTEVRYQEGWAIAIAANSDWLRSYFFRPVDGGWIPSQPNETLIGEPHTITTKQFTLTYWDWDEPYAQEMLDILTTAHNTTAANFGLELDQQFSYVMIPFDSTSARFELEPGAIELSSPTAKTMTEMEGRLDYRTEAVFAAANSILVSAKLPELPREAWPLTGALFMWNAEQIAAQLDLDSAIWMSSWEPPTGVTEEGWKPLAEMWTSWDTMPSSQTEQTEMMEIAAQGQLMIAYLLDNYGVEKIPVMMDAFQTAGSMEEWVTAVTGQPLDQFEAAWREWVIIEYLNH